MELKKITPDEFYSQYPPINCGWYRRGATREHDAKYILAAVQKIQPEMVLEIGTARGLFAAAMANVVAGNIITVGTTKDHDFSGVSTQRPEIPSHAELGSEVNQYGDGGRICRIAANVRWLNPDTLPPFDFVYIDGDHSFDGVYHDIGFALKVLKPKGHIFFHDVDQYPAEVTRAIEEYPANLTVNHIQGSWVGYIEY